MRTCRRCGKAIPSSAYQAAIMSDEDACHCRQWSTADRALLRSFAEWWKVAMIGAHGGKDWRLIEPADIDEFLASRAGDGKERR
jgi:hypothetical protein